MTQPNFEEAEAWRYRRLRAKILEHMDDKLKNFVTTDDLRQVLAQHNEHVTLKGLEAVQEMVAKKLSDASRGYSPVYGYRMNGEYAWTQEMTPGVRPQFKAYFLHVEEFRLPPVTRQEIEEFLTKGAAGAKEAEALLERIRESGIEEKPAAGGGDKDGSI